MSASVTEPAKSYGWNGVDCRTAAYCTAAAKTGQSAFGPVAAAIAPQLGLSPISQKFPAHCAVSRPTGGHLCWVRGPKGFDSGVAAKQYVKHGIIFAPGPMFSVTRSFGNFGRSIYPAPGARGRSTGAR